MKKIVSLLLILILLVGTVPAYADTALPDVEAEAAVLMDAATGKVLFEKNASEKMHPGAATMMLTALLGLENLTTTDYVTVTAEDLNGVGRSSLGLLVGEDVNVGTLITAMMTVAARDGASVVASQVSGSQEAFAAKMNEVAAKLELTNTNFTNSIGAVDENHYSSALDLAKIANFCMQNEVFQRVSSKSTFTVPVTNKTNPRNLSNNNLLLYDETARSRVYVNNVLRHCKYDGCTGIIAGYSAETGGVVVSSATRQGTTLIAVVLKSGEMSRFADSIKLLDYGFDNFKTVRISDGGFDTGVANVIGGKSKTVQTTVNDILMATIAADASASQVTTNVVFDEEIHAPLEVGMPVGTLQLISDNKVVAVYDIVTTEAVAEGGFFNNFSFHLPSGGILVKILVVILGVFLVLVLLFVAFLLNERRKTLKRKKAREKRRQQAQEAESALRRQWENSYRNKDYDE